MMLEKSLSDTVFVSAADANIKAKRLMKSAEERMTVRVRRNDFFIGGILSSFGDIPITVIFIITKK